MKITGVIAEYNPFHKGHEYQLKKARELSKCDGIAVVMSGNFVQRAEPAIIDKYKRAVSAIYGGADIVIELPLPFACQNAELFARYAILELKKLHITALSFGCEDDNIANLQHIADLQSNNKEYNFILKNGLNNGLSYPVAVNYAIEKTANSDIHNLIKSPNNMLALEYIKNIQALNLSLDYIPIKRVGQNHNDIILTGGYDSATAIRKSLTNNDFKIAQNSLTAKSFELIKLFFQENKSFNNLDNYIYNIYYKCLDLGKNNIKNMYEVSEGLENKLFDSLLKHKTINSLIMDIKSKRYTYSKIKRMLLNILLDLKTDDINYFSTNKNKYVKVLAFNDEGRKIINHAKQSGTIIIDKFSDYKRNNINIDKDKLFILTNKATNIYTLPYVSNTINKEYLQNAVYCTDLYE